MRPAGDCRVVSTGACVSGEASITTSCNRGRSVRAIKIEDECAKQLRTRWIDQGGSSAIRLDADF